ncbi:uncharacterized protein LOC106168545 [Lingula anatina]|uniref:Uncharacterized protein LOC106168545 n=1 Tax=Lingula anatina TaxID=7574 RepID=A0A1S3IYK9_LINAN|nr:uncharacterized protein LOC106168545 [Lingula anatina]|eukprot:XP_013403098.1 uncharacterized protein LOC106168545 [Lingula anatina]
MALQIDDQDSKPTDMADGAGIQATNTNKVDIPAMDDLLQDLETLDLTEEETENLLGEAQRINKILKAKLKEQEMQEAEIQSQKRRNLPPIERSQLSSAKKLYGTSVTRVSKSGSSCSRSSPSKLLGEQARPKSLDSARVKAHSKTAQKVKKQESQGGKQPWNDRFSYE